MREEIFSDILSFFEGRSLEYALYQLLEEKILAQFPVERIRVQKTQISFWTRHPFAIVSLRRGSGWPKHCITLTFGLDYQLDSPRIAQSVEPYPNRWTHHVPISSPEQIDGELLGWLDESFQFTESKRRSSFPAININIL